MALFALVLFVASALLFAIQPMIAKAVLPTLGGSPSVWNTCSAFFQVTLLGGYALAHATARAFRPRTQMMLYVGVLALALLFLPAGVPAFAADGPPSGSTPSLWLFARLAATVGLPLLALSGTAPMFQRVFAATRHKDAGEPYVLYVASNLGSLLALLAYPFFIEPAWPLGTQLRGWSLGFALLGVLAVLVTLTARPASVQPARGEPADRADFVGWAVLAFVPSSLLLGVTTYLTTDVAAVPLLWVGPLALYLLSFILCFSRVGARPIAWSGRLLPVAVLVLLPALAAGLVQPFWLPVHLLVFFPAAMVCHGELARRRPDVSRLTAFYLAISVGGVAGGLFNAFLAPRLFDRLAEYPLAIVLSCLVLAAVRSQGWTRAFRRADFVLPAVVLVVAATLLVDPGGISGTALGAFGTVLASGLVALAAWSLRSRPARFALTVGAVLLASGLSPGVDGRVLRRERNFFGVARITHDDRTNLRRLFYGNTLHGQQCLDPSRRREPLSYFHPTGPIGQIMDAARDRPSIAIVGLGAGSLAAYAQPSQRWTFYEIDPAVIRIAADRRYFTYLDDCLAESKIIIEGDARLELRRAEDRAYDLIVLDAFSSDALPVHLMTREALALYRRKLTPRGLLAFNLSNRYVDFDPVLGTLARDAGLVGRIRRDLDVTPAEKKAGKQPSIWAVLAQQETDMGPIAADPRWKPLRSPPGARPWTDSFSNVLGHLTLGVPSGRRKPPSP